MNDPGYHKLYERDEIRRSKRGPLGYVLGAVTAVVLPIHYSCKLYLVRELQKFGTNTSIIHEACLRELTAEAIRGCKEQSGLQGNNWRSAITNHIEQIAFLIKCRLDGDNMYMSAMNWPVPYVDILHKYGLLDK